MTERHIVFVNGVRVEVPRGSVALDAVRLADPSAADAIVRGERALTDSRGLPVSGQEPLHGGAILRIVSSRAAVGGSRQPGSS